VVAAQRAEMVGEGISGDALVVRRLKVVVRHRCEAPAVFQKRASRALSVSLPEPIDTQASIAICAGSRLSGAPTWSKTA
jgi:hypothetical protein